LSTAGTRKDDNVLVHLFGRCSASLSMHPSFLFSSSRFSSSSEAVPRPPIQPLPYALLMLSESSCLASPAATCPYARTCHLLFSLLKPLSRLTRPSSPSSSPPGPLSNPTLPSFSSAP